MIPDTAKQVRKPPPKGVQGAKAVKNDLRVVAPSKREAIKDNDKDESITACVDEHIAKDTQLKTRGFNQTNASMVSFRGEVADLMTSTQGSWFAHLEEKS